MFDREEWHIAKDTEQRMYCDVVDNTVDVMPERKTAYSVFIKVPSDLFSYLRQVSKLSIEALRANPVSFYLEEFEGVWILGIRLPGEDSMDLWSYKGQPNWAWRVR